MKPLPADVARGDVKYHRLSHAAYKSDQMAKAMATAVGFEFLLHLHDPATGADAMIFVSRAPREIVIAFRGTQKNYADIVTDLKFRKEALHLCHLEMILVHRGFRDQWVSIRHHIREELLKRDFAGYKVTVTGHSLGGALAVIAALEWSEVAGLVTFGAPRVSTREIIARMAGRLARHRRYVYGADIVPIVPLMTMGYRHDCRPIYLTRSGKAIQDCPLWREMLGRARALFSMHWIEGWSWCPVPKRIFTDHKIVVEYHDALAKAGSA